MFSLTIALEQQTEFFLLGVGRFTQYFDVTGQNETAGNVTMSLTHNFSTRLSFYASIYAAYQNEPNFQSNVGPENVRDCLSSTRSIFFRLLIAGLPRLTTVTSYTFERVKYRRVLGWTLVRIGSTARSASSLYLT